MGRRMHASKIFHAVFVIASKLNGMSILAITFQSNMFKTRELKMLLQKCNRHGW